MATNLAKAYVQIVPSAEGMNRSWGKILKKQEKKRGIQLLQK